jgi:hypothetical protein
VDIAIHSNQDCLDLITVEYEVVLSVLGILHSQNLEGWEDLSQTAWFENFAIHHIAGANMVLGMVEIFKNLLRCASETQQAPTLRENGQVAECV